MAVSIQITYIDFDTFSKLYIGKMDFIAVNRIVIDFNYLFDWFINNLYFEVIIYTMQLIVIRFLCTTFVAIEEDFCSSNIKNCFPSGKFSSGITTGQLPVDHEFTSLSILFLLAVKYW